MGEIEQTVTYSEDILAVHGDWKGAEDRTAFSAGTG